MVAPRKRVAIIGGRGIGRHHAKWWALEGAEVCAVVGRSQASATAQIAGLQELFPFNGRAYGSVAAMLAAEAPDIVDICSPPEAHGAQVRAALEAGCDVLCEKPFLYTPAWRPAALIAEAEALSALAETQGRLLGVCTQYAVGARLFDAFWRTRFPERRPARYAGRLESPAKGRPADPMRVWLDLGPHVISVFSSLYPEAELIKSTLSAESEGYGLRLSFSATLPAGGRVAAQCYVGNRTEAPLNVRRFALEDYDITVEGGQDAAGVYCARLHTPEGIVERPDLMRLLIRAFLAGRPVVTGAALIRDLSWLYSIADYLRAICEISGQPENHP